jgi:hypothetical protein
MHNDRTHKFNLEQVISYYVHYKIMITLGDLYEKEC